MQYLDYKQSSRQAIKLTQYGVIMAACLSLWFHPTSNKICQVIDTKIFFILNGSLQYSKFWQYCIGYLNHPVESWANVLVMAGLNILGLYSIAPHRRLKAFTDILYFWAFFQVVLFLTHAIFVDLLFVQRVSPSLVFTPLIKLNETLHIPNLKCTSTNCFPAGHALIAVYWATFSRHYANTRLRPIIYSIALCLILPRLFCGAHWFSDIVFTFFYAFFWLSLAEGAIYNSCTKYLSRTLQFIGLKQRASQSL